MDIKLNTLPFVRLHVPRSSSNYYLCAHPNPIYIFMLYLPSLKVYLMFIQVYILSVSVWYIPKESCTWMAQVSKYNLKNIIPNCHFIFRSSPLFHISRHTIPMSRCHIVAMSRHWLVAFW